MLACGEDGVVANLGPVQGFARVDVKQEEVAHFRDHEQHVVFRASLHRDGEVVGGLVGHGDLLRLRAEDSPGGVLVPAHLHDEQLGWRVQLLLFKAQHLGRVCSARHLDGSKGSCVPLQDLADFPVHGVELHGAHNHPGLVLADAHQQAPLAVGRHLVVDDLVAGGQGGVAVKNFDRAGITFNTPVENRSGGDHSYCFCIHPSPEHDSVCQSMGLHLGARLQVKDL
mmetsp:Transcript_39/g.56  ORF Transcript_39/g.56 Transcript_39/m.56 type:complete len:226 (-) Transcript_39:240-917(-)